MRKRSMKKLWLSSVNFFCRATKEKPRPSSSRKCCRWSINACSNSPSYTSSLLFSYPVTCPKCLYRTSWPLWSIFTTKCQICTAFTNYAKPWMCPAVHSTITFSAAQIEANTNPRRLNLCYFVPVFYKAGALCSYITVPRIISVSFVDILYRH